MTSYEGGVKKRENDKEVIGEKMRRSRYEEMVKKENGITQKIGKRNVMI